MSLYDGLDLDPEGKEKDPSKSSANATSIKFLQSQLLLKKAALQQTKQSLKSPSTPSSSTLLKPARFTPATKIPAIEHKIDIPHMSTTIQRIENEYDPLYPNEYDKVKAVQNAEAAALNASVKVNPFQATFSNTVGFRSALSAPGPAQEEEDDFSDVPDDILNLPKPILGGAAGRKTAGAAIPPPNYSNENVGGEAVAAKIMAKFGYKEGAGLGRQEQGISSALQVEKTSLRGGKILRETPASEFASTFYSTMPPPPAKTSNADAIKNPTKVLLLRNMVAPGDVDNDLEPEVKEECKKYGDVVSCLIYELPGQPEDEAVRIFVEFAKMDQAMKAVIDMNGRFFGGRSVKAGFYNVDKFKKFQLADPV